MHLYEKLNRHQNKMQSSALRPILLLDIDDTLIDCRHRKHKVFMDFIAQSTILQRFPDECAALAKLPWQDVQYRVDDNLARVSITSGAFSGELFQFWRKHYFTFPYLINDKAFPGSVEFTRHFYEKGVALVYLTGRDQAGMGKGTLVALDQLGFPTSGPDVHFLLKPDVGTDDFLFKQAALEAVAQIGPVLAAFENELANLNEMARRFPHAAVFWRKTLYAPQPPPPHPRVEILLEFP